jgi:hypothetical protein
MKYETPELTALTPAIKAIQGGKLIAPPKDSAEHKDDVAAYEDWEE